MIGMTIEQVAACVDGTISTEPADSLVTSIATDNRTISGGELFVAIAGERVDGNRFAQAALDAGAVAVLTADPAAACATGAAPERVIAVDDPIVALGRLAHEQAHIVRKCGAENFQVIGVTGSVGKTTTKDLLAHLLGQRGPIIAPPGSFNNELGMPLTVLRADESTSTLVLEMGADHIGNLAYLTGIVAPDVSVVLAVARAHLGEFGGIENVARAKSELVEGTREGGVVVLNYDDERVRDMAKLAPGKVIYFSASGACRDGVWASDVTLKETGQTSFVLHYGQSESRVELKLIGAHHVANALAAATVALVCGIELDDCARLLTEANAGSPHRMDVWERNGTTIIDDSYNANPDSMKAGLTALAHLGTHRRKIAVLGTMLELGEESEAEHAHIGELVAQLGIDTLIAVGPGLSPTILTARQGGVEVHETLNVAEATQLLTGLLAEGDVVLLKGSNGSGVWRLADALKENDR